jgi:hypothetical protein
MDQKEAVKIFLTQGNGLHTRFREHSSGDIHDLPFPPEIPGVSFRPEEMIALLEELEKQGVVFRSETVHPYESTEYRIQWHFVGEKPRGKASSV